MPKALTPLETYIATRVEMMDSPRFVAAGFDIGSGPTEAKGKTVALRIDGQSAGCRDYHRTERSLDGLVPGEDDEPVTLGETIAGEDARSHRGLDVPRRRSHRRLSLHRTKQRPHRLLDPATTTSCITP